MQRRSAKNGHSNARTPRRDPNPGTEWPEIPTERAIRCRAGKVRFAETGWWRLQSNTNRSPCYLPNIRVIFEKNSERITKNPRSACKPVVFYLLGKFENREKQGASTGANRDMNLPIQVRKPEIHLLPDVAINVQFLRLERTSARLAPRSHFDPNPDLALIGSRSGKRPCWTMAIPRSASAGASSRNATRFKAPRGSPASSARAAAVISHSIGIPPHLLLPPFEFPVPNYLTTNNER